MIILKDPLVLCLIIILVPLILANYIFRKDSGILRFSSLNYFKRIEQGSSVKYRHILIALRVLIIVLLVIRPCEATIRKGTFKGYYRGYRHNSGVGCFRQHACRRF